MILKHKWHYYKLTWPEMYVRMRLGSWLDLQRYKAKSNKQRHVELICFLHDSQEQMTLLETDLTQNVCPDVTILLIEYMHKAKTIKQRDIEKSLFALLFR